jgi:hypothetical protein
MPTFTVRPLRGRKAYNTNRVGNNYTVRKSRNKQSGKKVYIPLNQNAIQLNPDVLHEISKYLNNVRNKAALGIATGKAGVLVQSDMRKIMENRARAARKRRNDFNKYLITGLARLQAIHLLKKKYPTFNWNAVHLTKNHWRAANLTNNNWNAIRGLVGRRHGLLANIRNKRYNLKPHKK